MAQLLWILYSLSLALVFARRGVKKKSLSTSGAIAAALVGFTHMYAGFEYGTTLILFYLSSSKLTKLKQERKAALQEDFHEGGQRKAWQVLCNSLGGCIAAALASGILPLPAALGSPEQLQRAATGAFLGHYACCCADTWASEVGILSKAQPRLITTLRRVPPGTNGAVSALGTACTLAAGVFMGTVYAAAALIRQVITSQLDAAQGKQLELLGLPLVGGAQRAVVPPVLLVVGLCACMGLFGSWLDSVLGATVQFSGFNEGSRKVVGHPGPGVKHICGVNLLSNSAVNFVAATTTAVVSGACLVQMLGHVA